jgi:CubicO group peptidase (beta-lactamase class C family)
LDNPWAATRPVRVAHLLEHTAGLMDLTQTEFDHNRPFPDLPSALAFGAEHRHVLWPPGMHRSYSNAGAGLAARALERVTGTTWEAFLMERVLRPLGMDSASVRLDSRTGERLATGYDRDGRTVIPYWHMILPPLGAINATPREMAGLLQMLIARGIYRGERLLSPGSIRRMETPATTLAARSGLHYGYGLGLDQQLQGGFRLYGHSGDGDGYLSRLAYQPELEVGYFIAINAFNHTALEAMEAAVADRLLGNHEPPPPPSIELERERLAPLTGVYRAVTRRFGWESDASAALVVDLAEGSLHLRYASGRRLPLVPASGQHFRHPAEPVATMAFVEHDGERYLQGEFGSYRRIGPVAKHTTQ